MPVASTRTEPVPQVLDAMSDSTASSTTANDLDLIYLKGIMESPLEQEESLKEPRLSPVRENNVELLQEILRDLDPFTNRSDTAAELARILTQPHFQSLLETHDSVAAQACESPPPSPCDFVDHEPEDSQAHNHLPPDAIRMVGIRKIAGEHLANGREVGRDPRVLQEELQAASGIVVLKILPSYHESIPPVQFDFSCLPTLMLCSNNATGNLCTGVGGKKKKKMMYVTTKNAEFDRHEILLYEEVAKVPPFKRKTLILIGAQGVGRRRLKNKLLLRDPQLFGTIIPYTSRKPKKGERESRMFAFTTRSKMETDIKNGRYLEHGEYEGNLYGLKIDSIHEVVEAGRVCILDAN
ncbi:MAGUK p55 subfamily member 2-like, partial [Neolamprologus brichardi]|uniref:MAGUK p55 subfamily member 2-like n=1 Tax=Neolamprologus brichardi TaxID=32507 RepID=UPI0003EBD515